MNNKVCSIFFFGNIAVCCARCVGAAAPLQSRAKHVLPMPSGPTPICRTMPDCPKAMRPQAQESKRAPKTTCVQVRRNLPPHSIAAVFCRNFQIRDFLQRPAPSLYGSGTRLLIISHKLAGKELEPARVKTVAATRSPDCHGPSSSLPISTIHCH